MACGLSVEALITWIISRLGSPLFGNPTYEAIRTRLIIPIIGVVFIEQAMSNYRRFRVPGGTELIYES